jgi:alcohol dehydrogenase class IV
MSTTSPAHPESVFTYGAPLLKFGSGASDEIGYDLSRYGVQRVLVVTDAGLAATGIPQRVADQMTQFGIEARVYDGVHIEPTDLSLVAAIEEARSSGPWDAFVAVGGGSVIDTAKAMNLLATNDGDLLDYLNAPIGAGRAPARPLHPLIALPTTAGTGAESTPVCVVGMHDLRLKTGIGHPALRPRLAIVDPLTTVTMPRGVTIASGLDVLCHALESYTARPFHSRPRASAPAARAAYNGANPISDVWATHALGLLGRWFRRVVDQPDDLDAREGMMLAATYAGIGFGNAGVHIPHACAYPIAGLVRAYHAPGYPGDEPLVPHGLAVVATAVAAFRFTYPSAPERHDEAARLLTGRAHLAGRDALPDAVAELCRDVGAPAGLAAYGYDESDVQAIAAGAFRQERLLAVSPRPATLEELAGIVRASLHP